MHAHHERGIALVLALFLMSAMSVLAASLMFLSQTETYASMNYRMMSQARYAGESAVQKVSNFLLDTTQYHPPATVGTDLLTYYDRTKSPVVCNAGAPGCTSGAPVVLSVAAGHPSNYPVAAVKTAFDTAAQGTLAAGSAQIGYSAYATLMHMQMFESYGGGQAVVQTWQITGVGSLAGGRSATVEVVAVVETPKVPANSYAAFATANTCGAMYFHGNVTVDSYDSRDVLGYAHSHQDSGGDVGTNGNLQINGSVAVEGNLYSPRTGVGTCAAGAVNALSETGTADVTGSMIQLPTALTFPPPEFSVIPPTNTVTINSAATLAGACMSLSVNLILGVNCFVDAAAHSVRIDGNGTDVTLPSVVIGGGYKLIIDGNNPPQNVNINGLTGTGAVEINANLASDLGEAVVLKIAGKNPDGTDMTVPFDLSQMSWKQNSTSGHSLDSSALQIVYDGTAAIHMKGGNSQSAAVVYAPNASFELQGTQDLYGSVLARTITNAGNANIHYDRRLKTDFYVKGHPMMGTFTWSRS